MQPHAYVFIGLWLVSTAYALARGGGPERVVAIAQFLAGPASHWAVTGETGGAKYGSMEVGVFLVDAALFAIIVLVALVSARFWPIAQASMIGCDLLGHLAKHVAPTIVPQAYYVIVAMWGDPMVILLIVGTWRHRARLARYGTDPDWLWQLPRRYRKGWSAEALQSRAVASVRDV